MLLRSRNQDLVNENKHLKVEKQNYKNFRNNLDSLLDRVGEYVVHMDKDENVQKATEEHVTDFDRARSSLITLVTQLCDVGNKYREQLGM